MLCFPFTLTETSKRTDRKFLVLAYMIQDSVKASLSDS